MRHLAVLLLLLAAARAEGETTDSSLESEVDSYLHERAPRPAAVPMNGAWTLGPVFRNAEDTFKLRLRGRVLFDTFVGLRDLPCSDESRPATCASRSASTASRRSPSTP